MVKQSDVVSESTYMHRLGFHCPASLCLLVGAFNSFIFKVISDMYDPITNFLIKELRKFGFIFCGSFPFVVFPA